MKRRSCHTCAARGWLVAATVVASDAEGLQWFECDEHSPTDNIGGVTRTSTVPIADWLHAVGIEFEKLEDLDEPPPPTERNPQV